MGSGVVVTQDGYILTNNHVVSDSNGEDADEIRVKFGDDREYAAELIGRDPQTDIAVLKIEAKNLPNVPLANSDNVKVGDVSFAIGHPLNVGLTVTSGIVSATGRERRTPSTAPVRTARQAGSGCATGPRPSACLAIRVRAAMSLPAAIECATLEFGSTNSTSQRPTRLPP